MARLVIKIERIEGKAQVQWRAQRNPASGRWIGICEAMNLVTEADSENELRSLIDETMQLLLGDLLRDNELEQFLSERGWRIRKPPAETDPAEVKFKMPWQLVREGQRDTQRRTH